MEYSFSRKVSLVIQYSKEEAEKLHNPCISPEHLVLGMIKDKDNKAVYALESLYVDIYQVQQTLSELLHDKAEETQARVFGVVFDEAGTNALKGSVWESIRLNSSEINVEHLLLAIMRQKENKVTQIINSYDVTYQDIADKLKEANQPKPSSGLDFDEEDDDEGIQRQPLFNSGSEKKEAVGQKEATGTKEETPFLNQYGIDLTKLAAEDKLDSVIGREKEIDRICQILSRRKKNNPILVGDPGVGKTAIVEGLAIRINEGNVHYNLRDKRIVSLEMGTLVAGTKYRGEFENRIMGVLKELSRNRNIILFIDEIHNIVGAGSASGTMDAANLLKPALANGSLQCIGATTQDEYRQYFEKDGALDRRFQKVTVEQPSEEETLQILKNIKDKYEAHHRVRYTDKALEACVKLTARYIPERFFPDKAIDALDESGSRAHMKSIVVPAEIKEQEQEIEGIRKLKMQAVSRQDYELAGNLRNQECEMNDKLELLKQSWLEKEKESHADIDEAQIAEVVSMMSGVPSQRVSSTESSQLKEIGNKLKAKIIAQDKAIDTIAHAIQRNRLGLKDPNRPIGSFLFLGPTGVGKTYLAKQLALQFFGREEALIRLDMSEYSEKYTASRLIGSAPGYVGYDEGGELVEKVRRNPYSVILFDEIEKADSSIYNMLLQVLDEGRLTASNGKTANFKNTVIILTSNVGSRQLKDFRNSIGFASQMATQESENAHSRDIIQKALNKTFAPEFLNRLDEIITFNQLDQNAIEQIAQLEIDRLAQRIKESGFIMQTDADVVKHIATQGYDMQYGARPLRRAIQSKIEDKLVDLIIEQSLQPGCTIYIGMAEDGKDTVLSVKA